MGFEFARLGTESGSSCERSFVALRGALCRDHVTCDIALWSTGSIYEHCTRAIEKVLSRFSRRGLPLMGAGDWNDGFNLIGVNWKGESVWLAQFLYDILLRFAPIAERKKDKGTACRLGAR